MFILSSDYNGARYLWRRAPVAIKYDMSQFTSFWGIAKSLLKQDISAAFLLLMKTTWESNVVHIVEEISIKLRQNYIALLAKSYSKVSVAKIASTLVVPVCDGTHALGKMNTCVHMI